MHGEIQIDIGGDTLMYESNTNNLFPIISFFSKDKRLRLDLPLFAVAMEHAMLKRVREEEDDDRVCAPCADADQYEFVQIIKIRQISDVVQQHRVSDLSSRIIDIERNVHDTIDQFLANLQDENKW